MEHHEDDTPLRTGYGDVTDRSQDNKGELIKKQTNVQNPVIPPDNKETGDEDLLKMEREKMRKKKATKNALRRAHRGDQSDFLDFNNDPLSKVYKYYTGDDLEEFEEDYNYDELAAISDEEITAKDDISTIKREGKRRKVH